MIHYNGKLHQRAKELRKDMTLQEKKLWYQFLRSYPKKVYKQKIIGNYIVDFYCHSAKLVIELDGSQHFEHDNKEYDDIRTGFFNAQGIQVIRFSNREIDYDFDYVCKELDMILSK